MRENPAVPATVQWTLMLLPLLGLIFAAGGGWYMLRALEADVADVTSRVDAHLLESAGDQRRISGLESDVKRMDRDVIAICTATGARCTP